MFRQLLLPNCWCTAARSSLDKPTAEFFTACVPIPVFLQRENNKTGSPVHVKTLQSCARTRWKTRQNAASCVVVKLMRISVQGWRLAWNRAPGASR